MAHTVGITDVNEVKSFATSRTRWMYVAHAVGTLPTIYVLLVLCTYCTWNWNSNLSLTLVVDNAREILRLVWLLRVLLIQQLFERR